MAYIVRRTLMYIRMYGGALYILYMMNAPATER